MPTSDSSGVVMSKRAQQALRESEEKFSKAFKNSPDSICINRLIDGVYLEINDGFTSVTGYTMQEVIGRSSFPGDLDIWVNKEDRDRMVAGLKAHGEIVGLEAAFRMKTGQTRVGLMSARALELGGEACILSTTRDITERKQTEAALKASEAKYRELSNSVPMGIFEMDDRGTLTFANTTLYDWFGYTEAEFEAGINILDLADLQDRQLLKENLGRISSLQSSAPREYSLHRKTGGKIQVLALTKPILTHGHVQGFRGILLDLTEKKKMETVINNAARLESLGVLAGGIAHDFNNLLTGIFGYIDLARSVSRDGQAKEYLEETLTSMNRAKALTLQLLTFAKGGSPVRKITPLIPFIQETVQFALSGSNISCKFFWDENLWSCTIDKNQIGQVIDNIVINAQQAMPGGGAIAITASNMSFGENEFPSLASGKYVKVSFKDSGIGMSKEILPRIFDPFYTTKTKGHGLGLATCYSIVNRHGGCIDVESEPGAGSVFYVYLPASAGPAEKEKVVDVKHFGGGTILVVDDEEVIRTTLKKMLELLGYGVVCKSDGQEALDFFTSETKAGRRFSAMIFDLTIPGGMGGVETVTEIRKINKEIPVFVASGYADNSVLKNPVEFGFTASICKPFTIAEISELLENHVQ